MIFDKTKLTQKKEVKAGVYARFTVEMGHLGHLPLSGFACDEELEFRDTSKNGLKIARLGVLFKNNPN